MISSLLTVACSGGDPAKSGETQAQAQVTPTPETKDAPAGDEQAPTTAVAPDAVEPPAEPPSEAPAEPAAETGAETSGGDTTGGAAATEEDDDDGEEYDDDSAEANVKSIAVMPWKATAGTRSWTEVASPAAGLSFVMTLDAGVLGKAGASWQQGAAGALSAVSMDRDPVLPILGRWPDDAWYVESRTKEEDDFDYIELRLMKLRGGNRWVPQSYGPNGDQWFHPGTEDEVEPHISAVTGMLVYNDSLSDMTRVAGKSGDPELGSSKGDAYDFFETGRGKIYLISSDYQGTWAQTDCEDEDCVDAVAERFPAGSWSFGRRVARGRYAVSVLATNNGRTYILHQRGKAGGWVLDELPAGESAPAGMWASDEGGLWILTGDHLRWRDTDSAWHEIALPAGIKGISGAVSADRRELWLAGQVGGGTKVYVTNANADAPAAP